LAKKSYRKTTEASLEVKKKTKKKMKTSQKNITATMKRNINEAKTDEKKEPIKKTRSMKKISLVILPIIIILILIAFMWFTQSSNVITAQLIIESGTVDIKHAGGSWISAENGMILSESDSVRTGNNTYASVVLFESSIIRLDSNTEITLQEFIQEAGDTNVKIKQDAGRTWNTVLKVSGIDDYEVQTPTTIASVRGTSYDVHLYDDSQTEIGVSIGTVLVSSVQNGQIIDTIEVNKDEAVTIDPDTIGQPLEIKPFEKDDWVLLNQQKDEDIIEFGLSMYIGQTINVKEELYKRIEPYIPQLKEQYGVTDEELEVLINGYLKGEFDLPPETPNWIREIIELS
jgi:hypothetical protein